MGDEPDEIEGAIAAAGASAIASMTILLLQRGCPTELLDVAWDNLQVLSMAQSPGQMVEQFDLAIAEAKLR